MTTSSGSQQPSAGEETALASKWGLSLSETTGSKAVDIMEALLAGDPVWLVSVLELARELHLAALMTQDLDRASQSTLKRMRFCTPAGTDVSAERFTEPTHPATGVGDSWKPQESCGSKLQTSSG